MTLRPKGSVSLEDDVGVYKPHSPFVDAMADLLMVANGFEFCLGFV